MSLLEQPVRRHPTELTASRAEVEQLVCDLPGSPATNAMPFEKPWEIRAFAIAIAAYHAGQFRWDEFQLALIGSITAWEDRRSGSWSYYYHWLTALEDVLNGAGTLSTPTLDDQMLAVLAVPPNRNHHEAHTEPIAVDPAQNRPS